MKYKHINSGEIYNSDEPNLEKFNGHYGFLILTPCQKVFFITNINNTPEDMTEQFIVLDN